VFPPVTARLGRRTKDSQSPVLRDVDDDDVCRPLGRCAKIDYRCGMQV
jgi:hypothetical protein